MMRIGSVSITPKVRDHKDIPFGAFYDSFGKNTGNYMFTQAMYRQLDGDVKHIGFNFNPSYVNANFDHVVIPAANWLNAGADWDWLTDLIEKLEIPVTVIGIGLQAETTDLERVKVSDSAIRFIRTLGQKSPFVSTRGNFTRDWLNSIGVKNAVTTGCPSLYMRLDVPLPAVADRSGFVIQSTRYAMVPRFLQATGINRQLFRLAGELDAWMIYQSEMEELQYLACSAIANETADVFESSLPQLYAKQTRDALVDYLERRGKVFFDIDAWAGFVQQTHGVLGTRLHGTIVSLNAGIPALLVPHDSRTSEVAQFAELPIFSKPVGDLNYDSVIKILSEVDLDRYSEKRSENSAIYQSFLSACRLKWEPSAIF
jgi:hypothetical protein